uniref:S-adenosylmethionine mitochondrial carrier protein n=1 Tax=Meloidogyne floridensis TaxID=298350 RepID=A0A915P369_9BILA
MDENVKETQFTLVNQFRWLIAGAAAGLAVDLSLYPLDTIKTRMQSKVGFKASGGFGNIYKGIPAVALGSAPGSALFFISYSSCKEFLNTKMAVKQTPLTDAVSASIGEIFACIARVPTEIIKQRAQTNPQKRPLQIFGELLKEGYFSTLFREIPFSFIEFPLWEFLKQKRRKLTNKECSPLESAACGSIAGLIAAGITTPLDVLKTRVMLDRGSQNRQLLPLAVEIFKNEGIFRLYSGVLPRSLWMGIGGFIFFFSYEFSLKATQRIF